MHPDQVPPPNANITFPPGKGDRLTFNYLDSFVTTWVTPEVAETPCRISLYFWINHKSGWQRVWNQTAQLNGTTTIPLNYLTEPGLGQVNLDYLDPDDGSRFTALSGIFSAGHDSNPIAPSSKVWNSDALTKTSTTAPTAQPISSTAAPTALATNTLATATVTATAVPVPTSSPSVTYTSIASPSIIGDIVLGSVLGLLTMALLAIAWFRWQKKRQKAKPTTLGYHKQTAVKPRNSYLGWLCEKDARNVPTELSSADGGLELCGESNTRVELSTTRWKDRPATTASVGK